jgi:hypothetical protein
MRAHLMKTVFTALALVSLVFPVAAQTPSASVIVANPSYVTIPLEVTVNKSAEETWKVVGKYCAIAEWFPLPCTILSGDEDHIGAIRSVATEIMVGKTALSYTYTQAPTEGQPYNMYHGTLEARPLTATTSKLLYTLFFDNSMLPDVAAREKDRTGKSAVFNRALGNMKILAEGGTLLPKPEATR